MRHDLRTTMTVVPTTNIPIARITYVMPTTNTPTYILVTPRYNEY